MQSYQEMSREELMKEKTALEALFHIMIGKIMGIQISQAQLLCAPVVGVPEMRRNRRCLCGFNDVHGTADGQAGGVAFRRACHINGSLGKNQLSLRHSHPFHSLGCADRHHKGIGICISHILRSADHNPPGNKLYILPGIKHLGQIINCRIRIRAPHALDKSRNHVIVVISLPGRTEAGPGISVCP
mgnify:CR=1 FL=1